MTKGLSKVATGNSAIFGQPQSADILLEPTIAQNDVDKIDMTAEVERRSGKSNLSLHPDELQVLATKLTVFGKRLVNLHSSVILSDLQR